MKTAALIRVAALLFATGVCSAAQACFVSEEKAVLRDPIAAFQEAAAVFYATVTSWKQVDEYAAAATLELHKVWKGEPTTELINHLASDCSRRLKVGETYLIYAHMREGRLEVIGSFVPSSRAAVAVDQLEGRGR